MAWPPQKILVVDGYSVINSLRALRPGPESRLEKRVKPARPASLDRRAAAEIDDERRKKFGL